MQTLIIPETLQRFTQGQASCQLNIQTIGELKQALQQHFPDLTTALFQEGKLNPFARLAVNDNILDWPLDNTIQVKGNDQLELFVAVSGG